MSMLFCMQYNKQESTRRWPEEPESARFKGTGRKTLESLVTWSNLKTAVHMVPVGIILRAIFDFFYLTDVLTKGIKDVIVGLHMQYVTLQCTTTRGESAMDGYRKAMVYLQYTCVCRWFLENFGKAGRRNSHEQLWYQMQTYRGGTEVFLAAVARCEASWRRSVWGRLRNFQG